MIAWEPGAGDCYLEAERRGENTGPVHWCWLRCRDTRLRKRLLHPIGMAQQRMVEVSTFQEFQSVRQASAL
jgi:hypothetical protein